MAAALRRSLAASLLASVVAVPQAAGGAAAGEVSGRIAFARMVDGDYELFVMRSDGSNVRRLTFNRVDDIDPGWSPDGRHIVFERERGEYGFEDLHMIDLATGATRAWVVSSGIDEGDPAWSPDGEWIAYRGNDGGDGADVLALSVDRERGATVSAQDENSTNSDPAWSPDGSQVAVVESYDGASLKVASFCCGGEERIVTSSWDLRALDWSPDGSCIVYSEDRRRRTDIYTVRADGGGEPRLVLRDATAGAWSPDGSEILFYSDVSGSYDLYAMSPDGSGVRKLTDTPNLTEITPAAWPGSVAEPVTPECGMGSEPPTPAPSS